MTEVSVQGFMVYCLICNHLPNQCLHYCVIQYMHEFNVFFIFHPTVCLKYYKSDFYIMRLSFILYFWSTFLICISVSNCIRIITYAYLGDLPNRWLLILLSIFSLQLHLKKVKMAFSQVSFLVLRVQSQIV